MVALVGLLLLWFQAPTVVSMQPETGPGERLADHAVMFEDTALGWQCRISALSIPEFLHRLQGLGVSERILENPQFKNSLAEMLFFEIDWINNGIVDITFNLDQVQLLGKAGPAGTMLDVAHLWPGSDPSGQPSFGQEYVNPQQPRGADWKRVASLFKRGTVTITSDNHAARLLGFHPTDRRFPKRITLVLDRIYHGSEPLSLTTGCKVRYR